MTDDKEETFISERLIIANSLYGNNDENEMPDLIDIAVGLNEKVCGTCEHWISNTKGDDGVCMRIESEYQPKSIDKAWISHTDPCHPELNTRIDFGCTEWRSKL